MTDERWTSERGAGEEEQGEQDYKRDAMQGKDLRFHGGYEPPSE
jgi:hypothetical protein